MKELKNKIIDIFTMHWMAVVLASIVGLLLIMPTISSINRMGWHNFKGIYPIFNDDEVHYLAMTKEVEDGHAGLGNVFLYEHKDSPYMQPPLAELFFSKISEIFHISVPAIFTVNDFVFPFLGFLILYVLIFKITNSKIISIFGSLLYYLLFLFSFGRPINIQFSFIFLAAGLSLIWKITDDKGGGNKLALNAWLGFITGILVYIYPYFWTALAVLFGITLLFCVRKNNIIFYVKSAAVFFVVFILSALPYLFNLISASSSPDYEETMLRFGTLDTHWPACYVNVSLIFLASAVLYCNRKKIEDNNLRNFSFALLISGLLLNWQNVITGKYMQFSSHYNQVTILFVILSLLILLNSLHFDIRKKENFKCRNLVNPVIIFILLFIISYLKFNDFKNGLFLIGGISEQEMANLQQMSDVFNWFNKNSQPDSVIFNLAPKYEAFVPVYTKNNFYSAGYAGYYLLSDSEMVDRWVRQNIFYDNIDEQFIFNGHKSIWENKFIDRYQNSMIRNKILTRLLNKKISDNVLLPPE